MTDTVLGEVVDFPARRLDSADDPDETPAFPVPIGDGPRLPALTVPDDDGDEGPDDDRDRESVEAHRVLEGVPVDPPDELRPRRAPADRAPVIPPWMASRSALARSSAWMLRETRYHAAFHTVRAPKYAAKTAVFAPVGAVRTASRLARWASAEEGNCHLRQHAADRGEAETWLKLDARRQRQARWRWPTVAAGSVLALMALLLLAFGPVPAVARLAGVAAVIALLARLGRPADKPITDRVRQAGTYRKLTAELVRRALLSLQLAGINQAVAKDPARDLIPSGDPQGRSRSSGRRGPALRRGSCRRDRSPGTARVGSAAATGPGVARARARAHGTAGAVGRPRARVPDAPARVAAAAGRDGGPVQAVPVRHHAAPGHGPGITAVP